MAMIIMGGKKFLLSVKRKRGHQEHALKVSIPIKFQSSAPVTDEEKGLLLFRFLPHGSSMEMEYQ
jgi:hypothetical protein